MINNYNKIAFGIKVPHYAILKVPSYDLEVSYNKFTCIKGQTTI